MGQDVSREQQVRTICARQQHNAVALAGLELAQVKWGADVGLGADQLNRQADRVDGAALHAAVGHLLEQVGILPRCA